MPDRRLAPLCPECGGVRTVTVLLEVTIERDAHGRDLGVTRSVRRPCPTCQERAAPPARPS